MLAALLGCASALAGAQASGTIVIREVLQGETLIGIVQEMLDTPHSWQDLAAFNELKRPDLIRPGTRLRIPAPWLKPIAVEARVLNSNGEVRQGTRVLKAGDSLAEGQSLETGPGAVVTVELPDGSRLRIAPASAVRLERLRRYHDEQAIDALIRLERGRVEAVAQPGRTRPFLIRSPHATAAVRGTEFRVAALDEAATTEVLAGGVAWSGAGAPALAGPGAAAAAGPGAAVAAGFGSTADMLGKVSEPRALLPAPELRDVDRIVEVVSSRIAFPAVAGASAYRIEIAADQRFEKPLIETVSADPLIVLDSRNDGTHFVRVRAVDPSRLEGYDARAQVQVNARPIAPQPQRPAAGSIHFDTAAVLQWQSVPGVQGYRVQLAASPDFSRIVLDREVAGARWEVAPADAGTGVRYWRVASIDGKTGAGPFGVVGRLEWRPIPAAPTVTIDDERIELRWLAPAGHDSVVEVRWQGPAGELSRRHDLAGSATDRSIGLPIEGLPPGPASATLRLTAPDRVMSPMSRAVGWIVPDPVRSSDGRPLFLGSGGIVGSQGR